MLDSQSSFNPRPQVLYHTDSVPSVQEKLLCAITGFFTKLVTLVLQLPALQVSAIALADVFRGQRGVLNLLPMNDNVLSI